MMTQLDQLVFVGLNGYAVALDRDTGQIVWSNNELESGYVTLLLDGDRLIVSTDGYIFCLDPLTGRTMWNNPMSGYGGGTPTSLISVRGQSSQTVIQQTEAKRASHPSGPLTPSPMIGGVGYWMCVIDWRVPVTRLFGCDTMLSLLLSCTLVE
jgi:outer membrane protein assembly factor BamB